MKLHKSVKDILIRSLRNIDTQIAIQIIFAWCNEVIDVHGVKIWINNDTEVFIIVTQVLWWLYLILFIKIVCWKYLLVQYILLYL